tara:strand:- start:279 stop:659 length:381 start_codon:yes stop_codon:yes gene_type:complete
MSTRALIHIYEDEKDETPLTTIYKHYDGYPTENGVGETLKEYVMDSRIVNGLPLDPTDDMHNGMGCFAASLIKHLKDRAGDVYITKPGADQYESYIYTIAPVGDTGRLTLIVRNTSDESQEMLVAG